jgi:hypothetical protein
VTTVDAAPAFHPPFSSAFLEVEKMVPRHTALTTSTSHDALLLVRAWIKRSGQGFLWVDPKGVPQKEGDWDWFTGEVYLSVTIGK